MIEKLGRNLQLNDVLLCNGVHYKVIDLFPSKDNAVNVVAEGFVVSLFLQKITPFFQKHPLTEMTDGTVYLRSDKAVVMSEDYAFELHMSSLQ